MMLKTCQMSLIFFCSEIAENILNDFSASTAKPEDNLILSLVRLTLLKLLKLSRD